MQQLNNQATQQSTDGRLIDSSRVEGTAVYDIRGNHIGTVKRLVIEKISGRVVYAVISFGGFLGLGANEYTLPWSKLDYDTSLGGYRTDVSEQQLTGAPPFAETDQGWPDRERELQFNDYYGASYYWD